MHDSAVLNGNAQGGVTHEQELQASYHADFMNLDDNLFGLDSESRDFIFGTLSCCLTCLLYIFVTANLCSRSKRYG